MAKSLLKKYTIVSLLFILDKAKHRWLAVAMVKLVPRLGRGDLREGGTHCVGVGMRQVWRFALQAAHPTAVTMKRHHTVVHEVGQEGHQLGCCEDVKHT
jgi:hypothetical protein